MGQRATWCLPDEPVHTGSTRRLKTAKAVIDAVDILCPHCGDSIPSPGGSLYWTIDELPRAGKALYCSCGKFSKTPRVRRVK